MAVIAAMLAAACQGTDGGVRPAAGEEGQSQYAEKQQRAAYINSPAYINVQLGIAYMQRGEYQLALSKLRRALVQSPELAIAHNTIAILYERLGEHNLAETHYERSISLDSTDSRLRNNYGLFLCRHRDVKTAIAQFDIAASNPLYKAPYKPLANAGQCALQVNDLELADKYLRQALKLQPKLPNALASMVNVSLQQGNFLQGRAYLQRFLEVSNHTPDSLLYGYQIEKQLGNDDLAANYAVRLKTRHPDSEQTRKLLEIMNTR